MESRRLDLSGSQLKATFMVTDVTGLRLAGHSQSLLSRCHCVSAHRPLLPLFSVCDRRSSLGLSACNFTLEKMPSAVIDRQANGVSCHWISADVKCKVQWFNEHAIFVCHFLSDFKIIDLFSSVKFAALMKVQSIAQEICRYWLFFRSGQVFSVLMDPSRSNFLRVHSKYLKDNLEIKCSVASHRSK